MFAPQIQEVILCEPDRVANIRERVIRSIPIDAARAIQWHHFSDLFQASD